MKKEENSRRTERNVKRIRRCLVSWIQRKTGYVLVPLLFPKIIRNLYVTSRVIYEKVSPLLSSFGEEILMLTRTMSRSVETILRISSYLRIFILHPSPKKEEEEGKKESIHAKHSSNCAKMRTVRSINGSFDSRSGGASIAPTIKMIPSFRDLVPFPLPFSKKNFPCGAREAEQIFLLCKTDLTRTRAEFHVGRQR